ncbi:MAG TPA: preprotein translocase subunit YajC [Firmicutes bacterium]|nr:preprotein translocase subunit YajC [Bacillota bacterium]
MSSGTNWILEIAQAAAPADPSGGGTAAPGAASPWLGLFTTVFWLILMVGLFYLMFFRPQQQQQKRRQAMLDSLKKGDRIITTGGIHGQITDLHGDELTVRIADKVEIRLSRSGVASVKK